MGERESAQVRKCPRCGRPAERQTFAGVMCLPTNCDAWVVTAQFDHATREWVHPKVWERLQEVRSEDAG
jgi:hypothetical protein